MLVDRLDVQIRRPSETAFAQHHIVRTGGVEPDIENIGVGLEVVAAALAAIAGWKQVTNRPLIPGVRSVRGEDAFDVLDGHGIGVEAVAAAAAKRGDGNSPGALA